MTLLFAAALAAQAPAWEALCDDHDLQVMISAPREKRLANRSEVERRFAAVLAEERAHQRGMAGVPSAGHTTALAAALVLAGVLGLLVSVNRQSKVLAFAAVFPLAASVLVTSVPARRAAADQAKLVAFQECRLRLLDARSALILSDLAASLDTLAEAEEDLLAWEARLTNGERITMDQVKKLRSEVSSQGK